MSERQGANASEVADRTAQNDTPEPTLGLPPESVESLVPAELLQGGEIVVLLMKPSLWYIVLSRLGWLATIVVVAVGLVWFELRWRLGFYQPHNVTTVMMAAIAGVLAWQTLDWIARLYILTDRRVVRQMGFFRPQIFEAPLHRVQHTELHFSIRERVFGLGSLSFSTAGTGVREAYWLMVNQPLEVHRKVIQTINRYRRPE